MGERTDNPSALPPPVVPDAPPTQISPHITLQTPLSRRGKGPGLVLVADHYALLEKSEKSLDPPPLVKWAEEGYAVVQVLVPAKVEEDGDEFPLKKAVEVLKGCEGCVFGEGVGLICAFFFFFNSCFVYCVLVVLGRLLSSCGMEEAFSSIETA